jgi:hypothetical protein
MALDRGPVNQTLQVNCNISHAGMIKSGTESVCWNRTFCQVLGFQRWEDGGEH